MQQLFMKITLLAFIFICLTAGLHAQPFDGGVLFPPNGKSNNNNHRRLRPNQQEKQKEKTLDSRKPSDKLELQRLRYHRVLQPTQPANAESKNDQPDAKKPTATTMKPGSLPIPVSGPGNPLAPPPTKGKYPTMPAGKNIYECSHCHYIYYTNYMPDIVQCENPGLNHEWHLIGIKGTIWYRCINCNTHVCSSRTPIRSQCDLESKHIWEIVGQLTIKQQNEEMKQELE
jgi:hypothetical protein